EDFGYPLTAGVGPFLGHCSLSRSRVAGVVPLVSEPPRFRPAGILLRRFPALCQRGADADSSPMFWVAASFAPAPQVASRENSRQSTRHESTIRTSGIGRDIRVRRTRRRRGRG